MPLTKAAWKAKAEHNRKQAAEIRWMVHIVTLECDKEMLLQQSAQLERQADELEQYIAAP